jgi:hypothetical protein
LEIAVALTPLSVVPKIRYFIVEHLREFEVILKKALTRVSGAQGKLFDENKNERGGERISEVVK